MANEITITGKLEVGVGSFRPKLDSGRTTADQSATGGVHQEQTIGTTYEAISLGEVVTAGFAMFRNNDTTNFIQIGLDGGAALDPVIEIPAGKTAGPFKIDPAATLFALADTAPCILEVIILEN